MRTSSRRSTLDDDIALYECMSLDEIDAELRLLGAELRLLGIDPKHTKLPVGTVKHACRQEKRFKASTLERRKSMKHIKLHGLTFVHLICPGGVERYEPSYLRRN
jgi:hypothetical protein